MHTQSYVCSENTTLSESSTMETLNNNNSIINKHNIKTVKTDSQNFQTVNYM